MAAVHYLGGAAIVLSFAAVVLVAIGVRPPPIGISELAGFMGLGIGLALVGLADDVREGLSPWLRVVLEAAAGVVVWVLGDSVHVAGFPSWLDALVTVLWIVGVTNAFNLLDNMDGLSAEVATLSALTIFAIACLQDRYLVGALGIALAGCAAGFLWHNFHPAKIYMGDAGSQAEATEGRGAVEGLHTSAEVRSTDTGQVRRDLEVQEPICCLIANCPGS